MADVKWIKIVTDIFDDEKIKLIESNPNISDCIIVIWFKLLCLAGKSNNSGVFMLNEKIAYTDEMLATIFRRDIGTVRTALTTFENFGMIEIVNNVITIPNWSKHQNLDQLEERKEYMKEYMKKYRTKQKLITDNIAETSQTEDVNSKVNSKANVNSLEEDKNKNKNKNKNINNEHPKECSISKKDIDQRFEIIWSLYPKKLGKAKISDKQKKELYKLGDEIERCISRYMIHLEKNISWLEPQHGSTFFNKGYVDYLDCNFQGGGEDGTRTIPRTTTADKFTSERLDIPFTDDEEPPFE